jgi:hypothetical protein
MQVVDIHGSGCGGQRERVQFCQFIVVVVVVVVW